MLDILKIKNNEKELIRFLNEEHPSYQDLEQGACWALRNCKYEYFELIHKKVYTRHNDEYFLSNYFYKIIKLAAKYNKFDVYKRLFNDKNFNDYIDRDRLIEIISLGLRHYRLLSYTIYNTKLDKEQVYDLMLEFLNKRDFLSKKNIEKAFTVITKKYRFSFENMLDHMEYNCLLNSINYYNYGYFDFYDILTVIDKKEVFFNSMDKFIDYIPEYQQEKYLNKQKQIEFSKKVSCF